MQTSDARREFGNLESTVGRSDDERTDDVEEGDDEPNGGEDYRIDSDRPHDADSDDDYLADNGAAETDRNMITDLLMELERNQETFGRITETLGFSEKENLHLLEMLAQLRSERQELLANIANRHSKSRSRATSERQVPSADMSDSFANALQSEIDGLRIRVASLEDENAELKRKLSVKEREDEERRLQSASAARHALSPQPHATSAAANGDHLAQSTSASAARAAPSYHLEDDDDEEDEEDGPSTTVGSVEGSPLPYRNQSEHRGMVLVRDAAVQCTQDLSAESLSRSAPSPLPAQKHHDAHHDLAPTLKSNTGATIVTSSSSSTETLTVVKFDEVALAKHQLAFQAEEEKLWLMIHARTRELEHVSRLLASAEGRNVDLSTLLTRIYEQENEIHAHPLIAPINPAAAVVVPRPGAASPAKRTHGVQQQRKASVSSFAAVPQIRSSNVPPPPSRIQQANVSSHPLHAIPATSSGASSNAAGSDRPIRLKNTSVPSLFRRESNYGRIVLEKPKWS
ncbi:Hypothetical protein, putative [Bodo saltans]|uniref:Uncharacterized protein n=1 Tax=Bodo saltans TaxID=75058 RepID=A0A0S4J4J4_BODSA|nr:Hypothetical protein, putative [Bodo saltans]|eukprot:CUG44399.1 Hypothetical protein, putative [Bodo saltans]